MQYAYEIQVIHEKLLPTTGIEYQQSQELLYMRISTAIIIGTTLGDLRLSGNLPLLL